MYITKTITHYYTRQLNNLFGMQSWNIEIIIMQNKIRNTLVHESALNKYILTIKFPYIILYLLKLWFIPLLSSLQTLRIDDPNMRHILILLIDLIPFILQPFPQLMQLFRW